MSKSRLNRALVHVRKGPRLALHPLLPILHCPDAPVVPIGAELGKAGFRDLIMTEEITCTVVNKPGQLAVFNSASVGGDRSVRFKSFITPKPQRPRSRIPIWEPITSVWWRHRCYLCIVHLLVKRKSERAVRGGV